jgi:hypothetical protein
VASKTLKAVIVAIIITAVITFAISYIIFKYIPDSKANLKINEYKKELYTSTLCEYSCPLTLQEAQNKTQYLPEPVCVDNCTKAFKALQSGGGAIPSAQLKNDKLIDDMSAAVNSCKTEAVDINKKTLNNTLFFACSIEKLSALKGTYSYLN